MGLFGKSFEEKLAEAVATIQGMGLGVENLNASAAGKVVTLSGEAPSLDVKTRVAQELGNMLETENTINSIRVNRPAPAPAAPAASAAVAAAAAVALGTTAEAPIGAAVPRIHEVMKGDTLSAIAKKYYGSGNQYNKIFEANRDQLSDPDKIQVGQKLRIP